MSETKAQGGQALVEFVSLAGVLVAFLILLPVVGKYQDISHATQEASRYVAFDVAANHAGSAIYGPASNIQDEVRRRFFSESSAPIKTGDVAGDFEGHRNPLWTQPNGQPLIPKKSAITSSTSMASGLETKYFLERSALSLNSNGEVTAVVNAPLAKMPSDVNTLKELAGLDLSVQRQMVMLVDPWTAKAYADTNAHVAGVVSDQTRSLRSVERLADIAAELFELGGRGPDIGNLTRWESLVPADRMQ